VKGNISLIRERDEELVRTELSIVFCLIHALRISRQAVALCWIIFFD